MDSGAVEKGFTTIRNYITIKRMEDFEVTARKIYHYQKLHHSQTGFPPASKLVMIYHYQKLHHSQTHLLIMLHLGMIYHYQKLHHSQTGN